MAERNRQRRADRDFRLSLPARYRWRRVIAVLLAVAVMIGGVVVVGPHPRQWLVDRWYAWRGSVMPVTITAIHVTPASASVAGSRPENLVDGTQEVWTTPWSAGHRGGSCHSAQGPRITLTFASTRVQDLVIHAGAPSTQEDRLQRFRPRTISYAYDGGPCRSAEVRATGEAEVIAADSTAVVSTLDLVVTDAYPPATDGGQQSLSITEIALQARP